MSYNHNVLSFIMPQKKTNRRSKNSKNKLIEKRELIIREHGQHYAHVIKNLGSCSLEVFCYDGTTRIANIRGKFRKRVWIKVGDTILVSLRDYQDNKCDVIHKYDFEETKQLRIYGELPRQTNVIDIDVDSEQCAFDFEEI